jgi:uncharacterized protein (TIGR03118 family)
MCHRPALPITGKSRDPRTIQVLSGQMAVAIAFAVCCLALAASPASAQYSAVNLVSNTSALSPLASDPNMVNAWGLVSLPTSPWWVSNQNSSTSTLYMGSGAIVPLVVQIPCVESGTVTVPCPYPASGMLFEPLAGKLKFFGPTGIVGNSFSTTGAFTIPNSAEPAVFLFDTLDGLIVAWSPKVNPKQGVVVANRSSNGASYNGLAIAGPADDPHLYATSTVPNGKVDVFDSSFNLVNSFAADPNPPANFAPYGIQTIGNMLYVTYFNLTGPGGILDICNLSTGSTAPHCRRLFASMPSSSPVVLNGPWGLARSPSNFGVLSNKILVGNVNDGMIHAFDPDSGVVAGTLMLSNGMPLSVPGLWSLQFGHGAVANGPTNHLFFTAGPAPTGSPTLLFSEGLFGVITP